MKKTGVALLAVFMVFVLVACGGGGGNAAAGTYNVESLTMAGQTFTADELAANGVDISAFKAELKEGGEFTMTVTAGAESQVVNGTWTADGNRVSLTAEGETIEATLDGNKLTVSQDGAEMVFVK